MKLPRLAAALLGLCLALTAPAARAQDAAQLIELAYLAQHDPAAALARVEALLDETAVATAPDLRLVADLLQLRADLLAGLAGPRQTALALDRLGAFQNRHRDRLGDDPAPALRAAARAYEAAGDLRGARRMAAALLAAELSTGKGGTEIALIHDEIARLSDAAGLPGVAADARAAAALLRRPSQAGGVTRGPGEGFRQVDVYYATDRARTSLPDPREFYGYGRGPLELGIAAVTIPDVHVPGRIEAPSIWRLEFGPSPARHVILKSVEPLGQAAFLARLQAEFATDPGRDAFVFIHGYNVTFEAAAKRAAQIAHDMEYPGVPVLYSWPSRGSALGYMADAGVVRLSGRRLARFLEQLVARSGARSVHIVAHSMGNRALTDALELLALEHRLRPGDAPLFGQVLFAAPDVDAGLFVTMAGTFHPIARRLTLYASEKDWALVSSRKLHGDAPRAGQGGLDLLAAAHIDSIDMSALGDDMLAHSYFVDESSAIADIMTLLWQNPPPARRCGLVARAAAALSVWDYDAGGCGSHDLIALLAVLQQEKVGTLVDARRVLNRLTGDPGKIAALDPVLTRLFGAE